jgi:hypothetical protein
MLLFEQWRLGSDCNNTKKKSQNDISINRSRFSLGLSFWKGYSSYIYLLILIVYAFVKRVHSATEEVNGGEEKIIGRYQVAKFNFEHVSDVYAITLWILLGSLAKVGKSDSP